MSTAQHYPTHAPPASDLHARAVWHCQARAWWTVKAAEAKPRSGERRQRLAWARQHEARVVDLAIEAEHNRPVRHNPDTLTHHGRP